jgi:serine/threonine protein kinase
MRELSLTNSRLDKRYDIQQRLGQGSYAEIFVARDVLASPSSPHNLVVIKALNVFLQNDLDPDLERTLVENFQNEATALDRVRHPNIISRVGHGTARDLAGTLFHYLVLEYLAGGDLQRATREENLSLARSMRYIEQVCAGLRHAHRHGVIHRDIKPHNLLLTKDRETVKIADFGVARIHQNDAPITRVGTNVYAPPEHSPLHSTTHSNGSKASLTPAADIYSLAKSVYTLVTSEAPRPFSGHQITELPPPFRDKQWAEVLLPVLRKATEDDPTRRQQSIDEFWTDLGSVRAIAAEAEPSGTLRPALHSSPQPHVSRGYTPLAPRQPRFDTSRELKLRNPLIAQNARPTSGLGIEAVEPPASYSTIERVEDHWPIQQPRDVFDEPHHKEIIEIPQPPQSRKRFFRKTAVFVTSLALFAGALYATSAYLRGVGILPQISNPFADQTGRANTDINLRPDPSVNNDPIGLVTKNSRVRVVKIQNNWYQVDVLEQGRPRDQQLPTNRGWLNGKYIDLD